jgi:poly(hydroxyalkanoate) depolymerase family esterase
MTSTASEANLAVNVLHELLQRAARLTRGGLLRRAARALRGAGGGAPPRAEGPVHTTPPGAASSEPRGREAAAPSAEEPLHAPPPIALPFRPRAEASGRPASPLVETAPAGEWFETPDTVHPRPDAPPRGEFRAGAFVNPAGRRAFRLFVPPAATAAKRPLLVMLHGCKQNAEDFAVGTRMNELAQAQGWVVLYPEQPLSANGLGCWNWFKAGNQQRGRGEPKILADLMRHIVATEDIDPQRVYVAGLSAGGAMAATLAGTYPELFAAVGIHSGLPHAAAHDVMSAFQAMRDGPRPAQRAVPEPAVLLPTIVFHGDLDETVHPVNGEVLIASAAAPDGAAAPSWTRVERGRVPGGHAWTRTVHTSADGRIQAEHWLVHGAGHAWCGGSPEGSYTDPAGPDASAEMLRFFAAHLRQTEAAPAA